MHRTEENVAGNGLQPRASPVHFARGLTGVAVADQGLRATKMIDEITQQRGNVAKFEKARRHAIVEKWRAIQLVRDRQTVKRCNRNAFAGFYAKRVAARGRVTDMHQELNFRRSQLG